MRKIIIFGLSLSILIYGFALAEPLKRDRVDCSPMSASQNHLRPQSINTNIVYVKKNQTIQDVIDSITDESATNHYTIIVPPGTYNITSAMTMSDYISLVCNVPFGAIINWNTGASANNILTLASNIKLEGFFFKCNDLVEGVKGLNESNIIIKNCHIDEWSANAGCDISACQYVWIENSIGTNGHGDDAFAISDSGASVSSNVVIINCFGYDNYLENSGTMNGFEVEDGCHDVSIINCRGWNNQGGVIDIHSHTGEPICYNINVTNCVGSKIRTYHDDNLFHKNIHIENCTANCFDLLDLDSSLVSVVNEWTTFNDEENQLDLSSYWFNTDNVKNSKMSVFSKGRIMVGQIDTVQNCVFDFITDGQASIQSIDINNTTNCVTNALINRPATRPEEDLTSDAASAQKNVIVGDGSEFRIYQQVKITDDIANEQNYIASIDGNTLTMQNNLANTYTTANNAEVTTYSRAFHCDNSTDCQTSLTIQGADKYISFNGSTACSIRESRKSYVATLSANFTYNFQRGSILILDPGGAGRNITPETVSNYWPSGWTVTVINTADAAETLTFDPTGLNQAVAQNERGIFTYDGSNWLKVYVGS